VVFIGSDGDLERRLHLAEAGRAEAYRKVAQLQAEMTEEKAKVIDVARKARFDLQTVLQAVTQYYGVPQPRNRGTGPRAP